MVPVGAGSVHAEGKVVAVPQGHLLQMHDLVFQECNIFDVPYGKGCLIIAAKPVRRELILLILSAKGRAEPYCGTKELEVFT